MKNIKKQGRMDITKPWKNFRSGLRQKSAFRSGAVPLPTFFGIRGIAQRRGSTFFPVSKTFSTKRFPRNKEHVIGGETG